MSDLSDNPWAVPQPPTADENTSHALIWRLQLGAGAVCLLATCLGISAHYLHPRIASWTSAGQSALMTVCFLALGTRTALATGAVTREGWWLSRSTGTVLAVVAILAALSACVLGVGEFTGTP